MLMLIHATIIIPQWTVKILPNMGEESRKEAGELVELTFVVADQSDLIEHEYIMGVSKVPYDINWSYGHEKVPGSKTMVRFNEGQRFRKTFCIVDQSEEIVAVKPLKECYPTAETLHFLKMQEEWELDTAHAMDKAYA